MLEARANDAVVSTFEKDDTAPDTAVDNDCISDILADVLVSIDALNAVMVEFIIVPVDIAEATFES